LAHIRRHDYLVGLFQAVIETLMFYHPATWWISARIRQAAEECCDDWALAVCPDRRDYAAALARAAEWATDRRSLAVAATGGRLRARIRRVLELPPVEARARRWPAALLLLSALFVAGVSVHEDKEHVAMANQSVAKLAVDAVYDHFFYLRHDAKNGI